MKTDTILAVCPVSDWQGCYDDGWKGLIVDDAFAHPAKYACGLIQRIIDHGLRVGYWRKGDRLGDPFGGVALGGVVAAYRGLQWVGVELEPKFVALGNQNIDLHRLRWQNGKLPIPTLLQGDSRQFAEIVGQAEGIVTSPPYAEMDVASKPGGRRYGRDFAETGRSPRALGEMGAERYGQTPGQIGRLKPGSLEAVVTSPPYAESVKGQQQHGIEWEKAGPATGNRRRGEGCRHEETFKAQAGGYGSTEGNIGNLPRGKLDGICTSPPFENQSPAHDKPENYAGFQHVGSVKAGNTRYGYGDSQGQISNAAGETYWTAMRAVYAQCLQALKPGATMAVVVKAYVKTKKRVPLPDQTLDLLTHLGFQPVERVRALLVKEHTTPGLFGPETARTERKSFFRRLAEKKGSPPIDWEDVLFVQRPA